MLRSDCTVQRIARGLGATYPLADAATRALEAGCFEAVNLHFRGGVVVVNVLEVAIADDVLLMSTRLRTWTHSAAADQLILVENVGRGSACGTPFGSALKRKAHELTLAD